MAMFKRIVFFLLINLAVIAVIMTVTSVFGLDVLYLKSYGLDLKALAILSLLYGFAGAFISLLISKKIAKWSHHITPIEENTSDPTEQWLFITVKNLANEAGIGMPEVGIYDSSEVNAFATGAFRNSALVAVSRGLLDTMDREEVEGVLAHEVAHIQNGDMVTMTLLQGVLNAFVIFFARVAAYGVQKALGRDNESIGGLAYWVTSILFEILFGILAMVVLMAFSRWREFGADAGGARLAGPQKMIKALRKLQKTTEMINTKDTGLAAMKISGKKSRGFLRFWASHPPLEDRIAALEGRV